MDNRPRLFSKLFLNDVKLHSEQKFVLPHASKIFGWFYILVSKLCFQYIFQFDGFYQLALETQNKSFSFRESL